MSTALVAPEGHHHYLALGALALAALAYVYSILSGPLSKIPGPWYSNFTAAVLRYHWLTGKRAKYVHCLHEKYGPVVRVGPGEVDVMDVASTKEIHTVKATYTKAPQFYKPLGNMTPENLFTTVDVEFHRRHRRLLSGSLSETSLKAVHPIVEQRVELAIERMKQEMQTRGAADVFKWFLFMATDVIGELTFGESFRMLERGEKNEYIRNLEKLGAINAKRTTFPGLSKLAQRGVPVPGLTEVGEVAGKLIKYATESLQRHQRLAEQQTNGAIPTLFTKLLRGGGEDDGETLPFKEIMDEAQVYIIAGSDTTALTLTYLVWSVCRRPAVRRRLADEVALLGEDFHDADAQRLPYLGRVIEEALRLYPAVPSALPRVVPAGGATMAGHYLPPGSTVCTQSYSLHRNPDVYHDPEAFDPDRWEHATRDMRDSFIAFGGGSRVCIGLHLARTELRLATAHFFRTFPNAEVSTLEGMNDGDMEQMLFFLASPKGKRCLIECR